MALAELARGIKSFFKSDDVVTIEQHSLRADQAEINLANAVNLVWTGGSSVGNLRALDAALDEKVKVYTEKVK